MKRETGRNNSDPSLPLRHPTPIEKKKSAGEIQWQMIKANAMSTSSSAPRCRHPRLRRGLRNFSGCDPVQLHVGAWPADHRQRP